MKNRGRKGSTLAGERASRASFLAVAMTGVAASGCGAISETAGDAGIDAPFGPGADVSRVPVFDAAMGVDSSGADGTENDDRTVSMDGADGSSVGEASEGGEASATSDASDGATEAGLDGAPDTRSPDGSDSASEAGDDSTMSCDGFTDVSPTGANPFGPWSYGWSDTLGAAFTRYPNYYGSVDLATFQLLSAGAGPSAWTSAAPGGQFDPGAFFNGTGAVYLVGAAPNGTTTLQPNEFILHPGPSGQYSIARWTASTSGPVIIQVTFVGVVADGALTTTDVHVRQNGADLPGGSGWLNLNGSANTFSFLQNASVGAGDTLDVAVGNGDNGYSYDSTGVSGRICH